MLRRPAAVLAAVAAAIVVSDQVTKELVRSRIPIGTSIPLIGDVLRLTHTRNLGAAFGMLPGHRFVFITVVVLVLVGIGVYTARWRPTRPWIIVALGLVAGGAVGNLVDRVWFGMVTDFIQIPFSFPVFNLADSGIVVGVSMLVWWLLFGPGPTVAAVPAAGQDASDPAADAPDRAPAEPLAPAGPVSEKTD